MFLTVSRGDFITVSLASFRCLSLRSCSRGQTSSLFVRSVVYVFIYTVYLPAKYWWEVTADKRLKDVGFLQGYAPILPQEHYLCPGV